MSDFRKLAMRVLLFATAVALPGIVEAQEWPSRPVTIVNPFSSGSSSDALVRLLARMLTDKFGQPFVVENRTGGGGSIGTASVAKAPPDGHTILFNATGPAVLNGLMSKEVHYDTDKDFVPLMMLSEAPQVIVSDPKLGFKTLQDLIAYGKASPGRLNVGHAGAGSMGHLAAVLFLQRTGLHGSLVGYRGAAPLIQDVLGGHIQAGVPLYITAANNATILAVTSEQRVSFLPNVPTTKESGVDLVATTWIGFLMPAATPPDVVAKLNGAIDGYLKSDEGRGRFLAVGQVPVGGPPQRLAQQMAEDKVRWAPVISSEKITLDAN